MRAFNEIGAQTMHAQRKTCMNLRDKLSNGTRLMPGVDLRTPVGRRFRFLVGAYSSEVGPSLNESEKATIRQVASLQVHIEALQARIVAGQDVDADQLIRRNSEHRRLLSALHKKAEASKPAGQDPLAAHLQAKYGATIAHGDAADVAAAE
jgi:hypothetical protein